MEDKLIFTNHAKKRMIERNIKLDEIKEGVEFPDYVVNKDNKIESYKRIGERLLRIVYIRKGNFIKIITVIDRQ